MKANISAVGRKLTLGRGATLYSGATNVISFLSDAIATNSLTNSRSSGVIYGKLQGQGILANDTKAMSYNRHYFGDSLRFFNPDYDTVLASSGDGTTTVTSLTINVNGVSPADINCIRLNDITVSDPDDDIIKIFQVATTWDDFVLYINSYFMEGGYNHPYIVSLDGNNLKFENMYNTATLKEVELVKFDFDRSEFIAYTVDSEEDINFFEFSKPVSIINNVYEFGDEPQEILKVGEFTTVARDESTVSSVKTEVLTDGSVKLSLIVNNQEEDANENVTEHSAAITLIVAPDGTVTTSAPDPEETANSGEIATARWVRRITAGGVVYKGPFDASAGNYNALRNSYKGWMYVITTAGVIDGVDWRIGDFLIVDQDGGTAVSKIDNTESDDIVRLDAVQTLTNKTLTSPVLTGTPTAPTAATSDSSTKVATTQLVTNKIDALKNDNYFVKVGNVDQEVQGNKKWTQPVQRSLQNFTPTSVVESVDFISKNYDASNDKNTSNERAIIRDVTNSVIRLRDSVYNTNINTTVKASLDFVLGDDSKYYLEYITDSGLSLGIAAGDSSSKIPCTSWIQNEISTAIAAITLVAGFGIDTTNNVISVTDPVLVNTATGTGSYIIGGTNIVTGDFRTSIGTGAAGSTGSTSIGYNTGGGNYTVALGYNAIATGNYGIQIGQGTTSTANTFNVGFGTTGNYQMLDGTTGKIPNDRLNIDTTLSTSSANTVQNQVVATELNNKANVGLDNLNANGQMIIDSVDGKISNCILEIPQNLKLTLENNILTSKAGNVLVGGGNTYTTFTTTEDKTRNLSTLADGDYLIFSAFANGNIQLPHLVSKVLSGDTLPSISSDVEVFYLTTDKTFHLNDGTQSGFEGNWPVAYPLCVIEVTSGVASFVKDSNGNDIIFNGACFVGHHAVIYPNVKALISNFMNSDGTLSSVKKTNNELKIIEMTAVNSDNSWITTSTYSAGFELRYVGEDLDNPEDLLNYPYGVMHYVKNKNRMYLVSQNELSNQPVTPFIHYKYNGTTITQFDVKQPVRLATTEMLDKLESEIGSSETAIGDITNLTTTDKSNLVNAINELNADKQDTLVSGTNIKTINNTTVLGSGNFDLADQSLSNLDSTGQMVINSVDGKISNCILEIPQNIKVEISGSTITVKSGSIITNTGTTYSTTTLSSDVSRDFSSWGGDGQYFLIYQTSGSLTLYKVNQTGSGDTLPVDNSVYNRFYLITDERMYVWDNNAWVMSTAACYPLCVINKNGTAISFAKDSNGNDMIFNGACFVGHHAVVYPNVRKLICNGKTDGKLNSYDELVNGLYIIDLGQSVGSRAVISRNGNTYYGNLYWEVDKYSDLVAQSGIQYCRETNYCYSYTNGIFNEQPRLALIYITYNGTTVTDFTIRQPVRLATTEMLDDIQSKLVFDTTPTAGSTNPVTSDGIYNALTALQNTKTCGVYTSPALTSTNGVCTWNLTISDISFPSTATQGYFMCQLLDTATNKIVWADISTTNLSNQVTIEITSTSSLSAGAYKLLATRIYS